MHDGRINRFSDANNPPGRLSHNVNNIIREFSLNR